MNFIRIFEIQLVYCQFLGHVGIASFLRAPSTPSFLMKFGVWVPNRIIFVLVHGLGGVFSAKKIPEMVVKVS